MTQTLLSILNVPQNPNKLGDSALLIIDAQLEYVTGSLPLEGVTDAIDKIEELLERARTAERPIFFMRHVAGEDAPIFNPNMPQFQIVDQLEPKFGEVVIDKNFPSSFAQTDLHDRLSALGLKNLIVTGFMTHACISATVRNAAELGYRSTVVAEACATRDLPSADGSVVPAKQVHDANLAALQDVFASIAPTGDLIED